MSSTVVANMKFCDKKNIVTATLKDDGTVDIEIKSDCKNVQYYAEHLKNVTIDDVSNVRNSKIVDPDIRQSMSAPCLTPNAVFYAAWLELGMLSKSRAKLVETNEIIFDIGEWMGRHVMEALGKSRIVFEDGKIVEISEPVVKYCPLFAKHRNIHELNKDTIKTNMEFRMKSFGMCCENRETKLNNFLNFGISEIMSLCLSKGFFDVVVTASDGSGTCLITDPAIVQGMGGRISAIVETSPIKKVIEDIGEDNILDPKTTTINQRLGVKKAVEKGYKKIAVTVAFANDAKFLREEYGDLVTIFAVHTTGISLEDAECYFKYADVITACASKYVREVGSKVALVQAGTKVPVYAATEFGKSIIMEKLNELGRKPDTTLDENPYPLI